MNFKLALIFSMIFHLLIIIAIVLIFKTSEKSPEISTMSAIKIHLNLGGSKINQAGTNQVIKSLQGRGIAVSDHVSKLKSEASSHDKNNQNELLLYLHESVQKNLVYPESAALLDQSGIVRLQFLLTTAGQIQDITLLKSSGYAELDAAAIKALRTIIVPKQVFHQKTSKLSLDIEFYQS